MFVRIKNYPTQNPWLSDIMDFDRNIQNVFGDMFDAMPVTGRGSYPLFDLAEYENDSVLVAELPGVQKEDIKISIDNGYLSISGERKAYDMPEQSNWVRNEIRIK